MRKTIIASLSCVLLLVQCAIAANPFLQAADDKPVSAIFRGSEWNDDLGAGETPLRARVVTTRVAAMSWGAIFKIEFREVKSRARKHRQITPDYYIVTDDKIILLNEEDNDTAVRRAAAMETAPSFAPNEVYGIAEGRIEHQDGPWSITVETKADKCTYSASHNSGHFKTVVWRKRVGLVEYASGYGAHADGFRLRRN